MPTISGTVDRIFLSHASADAPFAQSLCTALERAGNICWIAPRDVQAGALYADAIIRAINDCSVVVLVLSAGAIASTHVSKEVERASSKRRRIIVIRTDSAPLTPALEYFLSESQWIETAGHKEAEVLARLVDAIHSPSGIPPHAGPSTDPRPTASFGSRRKLLVTLAVLGVLGILGASLLADRIYIDRIYSARRASAEHSASAGTSAPAADDRSIAVLPFADMSEKKDQEYFSDGLAEELIDELGKVGGLHVIARTSSFSFKGKSEDIPTIARSLNVVNILEGSVRKAGERLRVSTQLVRATTGETLWSETYDRELKDVFQVQDEIASSVIAALKVRLNAGQQLPHSHGTANLEAYDQYLIGEEFRNRFSVENTRRAVEAYRKATELDPHYGAALAMLAYSQAHTLDDSKQLFDHCVELADQAVKLAPNDSVPYSVRAFFRITYLWDWSGAKADIDQALSIGPNDAPAYLARSTLGMATGNLAAAFADANKANELDPLSTDTWIQVGSALMFSGRYPEARAAYDHVHRLQPASSNYFSGTLDLLDGRAAQALATAQQEFQTGNPLALVLIAMAQYSLGNETESQNAIKTMTTKGTAWAYQLATAYAWRGEKDKALGWLDKAYVNHDTGLIGIKTDPTLNSLHADPRFKELLRKMRLPD